MPTKEELFSKYTEARDKLAALEQQVEGQKSTVSDVVRQIHDEHGKGPYDLNDGRKGGYVIACRGGSTYFFTPKNKRPK